MLEKRAEYKTDTVISDKVRLQLMVKRMIDLGRDIEKLTEEGKRFVIQGVE
ncbi:hypothetical protein [Clostridium formicaceticum]|uniref:Uncharacterized protein n=1 Tax=Clostridium formicaceticum TaxID=1497 RepID=A0AAC9RKU7_9CLOT|nr:hypothetical protein [Clostridium formicaceticum]ARE87138.1 hypothetical protein CLFO_15240 [Clostridium formicaceticum]